MWEDGVDLRRWAFLSFQEFKRDLFELWRCTHDQGAIQHAVKLYRTNASDEDANNATLLYSSFIAACGAPEQYPVALADVRAVLRRTDITTECRMSAFMEALFLLSRMGSVAESRAIESGLELFWRPEMTEECGMIMGACRYNQGWLRRYERNYPEALRNFITASNYLDVYPSRHVSQATRGFAHLAAAEELARAGSISEARIHLEVGIDAFGTGPCSHYGLVAQSFVAICAGDAECALTILPIAADLAREKGARDAEVRAEVLLVRALVWSQRYEEAHQQYRKACRRAALLQQSFLLDEVASDVMLL